MSAKVPGDALDVLLRKARSFNDFTSEPVSENQLRALYDIMKWGPDHREFAAAAHRVRAQRRGKRTADARDVVRQQEKELWRRRRSRSLPMTCASSSTCRSCSTIRRARSWYETTPEAIRTTALRNASLQGAYFIMAARAIGLDCSPMSGFNNEKVDAEFFPDGRFKSNFICAVGRGDPSTLPPEGYRFSFDEACKII